VSLTVKGRIATLESRVERLRTKARASLACIQMLSDVLKENQKRIRRLEGRVAELQVDLDEEARQSKRGWWRRS
jgi:hypothetical protein